ncbi:HGGxSTG domain-containing protein [Methylocapsa palsarum]|uniref:Uncharacterized protein n=1 Tax=Methylocapsa palsarum TaxID=1612308 RepID=A0A1I4CGU1_9HYPH|nr:hypothetical protein SAMN05444581_12141 [Methylocapsa palsarum]
MTFPRKAKRLYTFHRSPAWRKRCSDLMKRINAERLAAGPAGRCGARRKRDGEPCQQLVLFSNGRCKFHGGKTPKGKNWHKLQLPPSDAGADADALARKERMIFQRQKKRAAARAAKLAAMTPEQRAAYDNQFAKRVTTPGPVAHRAGIRKAAARRQSLP